MTDTPKRTRRKATPAAAPEGPVRAVEHLTDPDDLPAAGAAPGGPHGGVRVAFVADVHVGVPRWCGGAVEVGLNTRARHVVDVLRAAVERAHALKCCALFVCGDLFDTASPSPQVVAAVGRALSNTLPDGVHVLTGNHDMVSESPGDHALAPLALMPWIHVHDGPGWVRVGADVDGFGAVNVLLLPFRSGDAKMRLRDDVHAALNDTVNMTGPRVIAMHAGISDAATPPHLRGTAGAVPLQQVAALARTVGASAVFAGDWHDRRAWDVTGDDGSQPVQVMQVGALVPTDFRNPGLDGFGTFALWSPGYGATHEVMPGARFLTVHDRAGFDAARDKARARSDLRVFVRWVAAPHDFADAVAMMREETTIGLFAGGDVVPVVDAARADVRAAVANAAQPASLRAAVALYIEAMPDLDPARRVRVRDAALNYMRLQGV